MLNDAISKGALSSRQLGELYAAYVGANESSRERLVQDPLLVLRAREEARREGDANRTPVEHVLEDLRIVTNVARRATSRIRRGALDDPRWRHRPASRCVARGHRSYDRDEQACRSGAHRRLHAVHGRASVWAPGVRLIPLPTRRSSVDRAT